MAETSESTPLLSTEDDSRQTMLQEVTNFEASINATQPAGTVLDRPSAYQQATPAATAQSSHTQSLTQYPQSGNSQLQAVVTNQPTAGYVQQQQTIVHQSYYASNIRVCLFIMFVWSCLTCLACWPLAITSCCLTGYAIRSVSKGEDPKALMIGGILSIVASLFLGVPFTWASVFLIYKLAIHS